MLSTLEILELEKKVFRYRLKRRFFYALITLLIVSCATLSFIFYVERSFLNVKNEISVEKNIESNETVQVPILEENLTTQAVSVSENFKENILTLSSPKVILTKEQINDIALKELPKSALKEPKDNISASKNEIFFYRSAEEKIDTSVLTPPSLELEKPKGLIKIESQDVHSISQLKDKFEKTQNIVFALMLAEEFYNAKNYKESVKWSLMANQSDPENEKSWIWFAKSKIKLGEKEDAITALKAFLKHNKSRAAQTLLNQINLGELHE